MTLVDASRLCDPTDPPACPLCGPPQLVRSDGRPLGRCQRCWSDSRSYPEGTVRPGPRRRGWRVKLPAGTWGPWHPTDPNQPTLPGVDVDTAVAHTRIGHPPAPPQPVHRVDDLATAQQAGRDAADPENLTVRQLQVLTALVHAGERGLTDFEHHPINRIHQTSAGKRRLELQRAGLVQIHPTLRRPAPSGKPVSVWIATDLGVAVWRRLRADRRTA